MKSRLVEFLQAFRQATNEIGCLILKFRVNQVKQKLQLIDYLVNFLAGVQCIKQLTDLFEIFIGICRLHILIAAPALHNDITVRPLAECVAHGVV